MKTPREILLAKHESTSANLDAVRRRALREIPVSQNEPPFILSGFARAIWRELLLPNRSIVALVSPLWLLAVLLHATSLHLGNSSTQTPLPSRMAVVEGLRERQRLYAELSGQQPIDFLPFRPKPRSEFSITVIG